MENSLKLSIQFGNRNNRKMDFKEELERMKDPIGYWYKDLSDYDIEELEQIKSHFEKRLDEYASYAKEELYHEIETHISKEAKLIELQNLDNHIRVDLDYNGAYQTVVMPMGSEIVEKRYLEFAYAYKILDDESRGLRVLKNIVRRNLIKILVREIQMPKVTSTKMKYRNVFENVNSEKFFFQVIENDQFELNRRYISTLYRFLKSKYGRSKQDVSIKCNELIFADFWNDLNTGLIIKKYQRSAGLASTDQKHTSFHFIESIYHDFVKTNS